MNDQVVQELKQLQSNIQNLISETKSVGDTLERLRSIEQLLERVAGSNERIEKMMEQSWKAYSSMKDATINKPR